jgi:antimicrobial peptide system SdpB family protein
MQMAKNQFLHITYLDKWTSISIVGFARSILAAGMLLTLMFNNIPSLLTNDNLQTYAVPTLHNRLNFFLLFQPAHMLQMQFLAIIILLITISGYFIGLTSLLNFWIAASFYFLKPLNVGGDNINMLLTLLLIPVCLFDERKNHWHPAVTKENPNRLVQYIFLAMIKLQVAYIYFDAVLKKLQVKDWRNGKMIYYWFTDNFFGFDKAFTKYADPFLTNSSFLLILSWGSIILESIIVLGIIFSQRHKLLLLKFAITFHLLIMLIHGFSSFFFAISGGLLLSLYPGKIEFNFRGHHLFLFYGYVFMIVLIANLLPNSSYKNWFEIIFTLAGVAMLFIRHSKKRVWM